MVFLFGEGVKIQHLTSYIITGVYANLSPFFFGQLALAGALSTCLSLVSEWFRFNHDCLI